VCSCARQDLVGSNPMKCTLLYVERKIVTCDRDTYCCASHMIKFFLLLFTLALKFMETHFTGRE
jgi:hypothetical protein